MANEDQKKAATKRTGANPSPTKAKTPAKTTAKQAAATRTKSPSRPATAPAPAAPRSARKAGAQKTPTRTVAATPAKTRTKTPASAKPATKRGLSISPEERENMIRMAAYFKAEKRQFAPGFEVQDWADAEREVDEWLRQRRRAD